MAERLSDSEAELRADVRRGAGWPAAALALAAVAALVAVRIWSPPDPGDAPPPPELAAIRQQLAQTVRTWEPGDWARPDGYTYGVDVGLLMCWAAEAGERPVYERARDWAARHLVHRDAADELTDGFVVWRTRPGEHPDASGTTEALRVAEGLWRGGRRFNLEADGALALLVLKGYARHAGQERGVWLVRNYFNFGTRGFASNSYLVDYDPDLLMEVAAATRDGELAVLAGKSYEMMAAAAAPCGLVYDLIQPEIGTLTPDLGIGVFSPNDVIQLGNSAEVARVCAVGRPEVGRGVLAFARRQGRDLRMYYTGREGRVVKQEFWAGPETYAALVRLAARLGDRAAAAALTDGLRKTAGEWMVKPQGPRLYTACSILLAIDEATPREVASLEVAAKP